MRNLIVETQSTTSFKESISLPHKNYHCCYDYDKNIYYLVECNDNIIYIINVANESYSIKKIIVKIDNPKPVGIECCSNNEELYIAYDCGLVYELKEFDEKLYETSEVAEFPSGLYCMKISPDNEIAVFVAKDLTVTVITCKFFDCLNSVSFIIFL
jgi:WD40 repeat protein